MIKKVLLYVILIVFILNVSFVKLIFGLTNTGWLANLIYLFVLPIVFFHSYEKSKFIEWGYVVVMLLGLFLHEFLPVNEKFTFKDALQWTAPVVVLIASRKYKVSSMVLYAVLAFYIIHCSIAIVERSLQQALFEYTFVEGFSVYTGDNEFRAFGLMEHPLQSANVTLIIMAFIMISKRIKKHFKIVLLALGFLGIVSFNSRFAFIVSLCLLSYRFLFYNVKPTLIVISGVIIYTFFLSDIGMFIQQNSDIFGRLAEKNSLKDESSLTRLLSFNYFWNARWNVQDIILGGRVLYLGKSELTLENGFLLTITWWGWIVGISKTLLELLISYRCLSFYNKKDRIIVLIATWLTAYSNNNTFYSFVFVFFLISFIGLSSFEQQKLKETFRMKSLKLQTNRDKELS